MQMISFSGSLSPCMGRATLFCPFHCPSSLPLRAPFQERAERQLPLVTLLFAPAAGVPAPLGRTLKFSSSSASSSKGKTWPELSVAPPALGSRAWSVPARWQIKAVTDSTVTGDAGRVCLVVILPGQCEAALRFGTRLVCSRIFFYNGSFISNRFHILE